MSTKKATKRALLTSILAICLCLVMLVGSTFAWFTDTTSTGVNRIQAGNLKVDIVDATNTDTILTGKTLTWKTADNRAQDQILWEPGCKYELQPIRIKNNGNLALKYKIEITGIQGDAKLNEAIEWTINGEAIDLVEKMLNAGATSDALTIKGHMKEDAGNEYMDLSIDSIGITVYATQAPVEYDSFNNTYDAGAEYLDAVTITPANAQDYLDGKYGSIDGKTLILAAGDYGTLELGRATKYEGSNTEYRIGGFTGDAMTFDDFYARKNDGKFSEPPYYTRTISNVTLKAAGEGVNVNGIKMTSGHRYGSAAASITDYVLDRTISDNGGYYLAHHVNNLKFNGLNFTGVAFIYSACADTTFDGVTFVNCEFNGGGTDSNAAKGVDFRSEEGVAAMRNLTVTNCKFNNCYQGVYTQFINGITVADNEFDTTGHNAIAVQTGSNPFNHGAVIITNNTFTNIRDRIIRFGYVGADTQITIKNNTATSSGDSAGEVIKATSLADGITYDISGNDWGTGKTVVNEQLKDK